MNFAIDEIKLNQEIILKDGTIKINTMFHQPSTVTIITNGKEETIDFSYKTIGYNYEILHFNDLLRQEKTESDIMSFAFSKKLIETLDKIRNIINLQY